MRVCLAVSCVSFALAATPACAQFPERAVTLVVPSAPGDEADTSARLIATKLTVVIDEKYTELAVRVLHRAFELDQE